MGEIKLNRSLDLRELRKEQRRVAALLGHQSHIKPSGALYVSTNLSVDELGVSVGLCCFYFFKCEL